MSKVLDALEAGLNFIFSPLAPTAEEEAAGLLEDKLRSNPNIIIFPGAIVEDLVQAPGPVMYCHE